MKTIQTTYREKVITYNQEKDEWTCPDFAHGRGSPSLSQAKARIDKVLDGPDDKPAPFKRVKAWTSRFGYDRNWQLVTLTSKAEKSYWASNGQEKKKLSEHDSSWNLKADTPENAEKVEKMKAIEAEIVALRDSFSKLESSLTRFKEEK